MLAEVRVRGDGEVSLRVGAATDNARRGSSKATSSCSTCRPTSTSDRRGGARGGGRQDACASARRRSSSQVRPQPSCWWPPSAMRAASLVEADSDRRRLRRRRAVRLRSSGRRVTVVEESSRPAPMPSSTSPIAGPRSSARQVEQWRPRRADLVVADPSRSGLGRQAVAVLRPPRRSGSCWSVAIRCRSPAMPACSAKSATTTCDRPCTTCSRRPITSRWSPPSTGGQSTR